ncbi:MAG: YitT family protein [Defluviitaleaceae bacterium]|nr:YitT family protein [Defluviitaleaceae bacterium]
MVAGTFLMALGISMFYAPNNLITGGVSGLAIIIDYYASKAGLNIPIWLTNIVLNVPLFLLGLRTMTRKFLVRTAVATACFSLMLYLTELIPLPGITDLVLISVFGGVLGGAGMAMVLAANSTTGGTDMAASIINNRLLKHISVSTLLFALDGTIIAAGLLVFGWVHAMYAIIAVFINSKVISVIFEGLSYAKAVFIISGKPDEISARIMSEMDRGVTGLSGKGMYTRQEKNVLLCVAPAKEIVKLKEIVHGVDETAFVIVADVREVMGEGFKRRL